MQPTDRKIFHITHLNNLPGIVAAGGLWSENECRARGLTHRNIGHLHIKARRRQRTVDVMAGGVLADYVPFNFCPRSVMLYVVSRGHPDYQGGQRQVVHLVSSVGAAVALGRPWAFTDRHAELGHAQHYDDLTRMDEVAWSVMPKRDWRGLAEERQAEFLVKGRFDWSAVVEVAVYDPEARAAVIEAIGGAAHQPPVVVQPAWYYEESR